MGATLVRELFDRVSTQLNDKTPQFTRWKQRHLVDAANDGARAIAKYLPWSCARVDVVKLSPGSKQSIELISSGDVIPGDGSTPANVRGTFLQTVLRNMGSNGATPGAPIRPIDRDALDTTDAGWHAPQAGAYGGVKGFVFDPRFPKVWYAWPAPPAGATWWVEKSFLADPALIPHAADGVYAHDGASSLTIPVDDRYVDDMMNYMIARCHMMDVEEANPAVAQTHTQLFLGSINAQAAATTGVNPNLQSLPFAPNVPAKSGR